MARQCGEDRRFRQDLPQDPAKPGRTRSRLGSVPAKTCAVSRAGLAPATRCGYGAVMDGTTTQRLPARPLALPNLLTYARIVAVSAVVVWIYWEGHLQRGG